MDAPPMEAPPVGKPYRASDDTYVIPQLFMAPPIGYFYCNSLVIKAKEPVIVDTGTPLGRKDWFERAFELVDPKDVRWIFLSHDDRDHSGNLIQVLDACPNATLVTSWFAIGRMAEEWMIPLDRVHLMYDGDSFDAGDRTLTLVRPPFFDSPVTVGLFDAKTRTYWSVDSFATPQAHEAEDVAQLDQEAWRDGVLLANRLNHPWFQWLDEAKWGKHVDRVQGLGIEHIVGCHTPAIHGAAAVEEAFGLIRRVPSMEPWKEPTQDDLMQLIGSMTAGEEGATAPVPS
jgi:hypothetical protein